MEVAEAPQMAEVPDAANTEPGSSSQAAPSDRRYEFVQQLVTETAMLWADERRRRERIRKGKMKEPVEPEPCAEFFDSNERRFYFRGHSVSDGGANEVEEIDEYRSQDEQFYDDIRWEHESNDSTVGSAASLDNSLSAPDLRPVEPEFLLPDEMTQDHTVQTDLI